MPSKTLNIRSQDRNDVSKDSYDPNVNLANCNYTLEKPISLKSDGVVGLRSAYFPITFKHVDKTNDRFAIRFLPAHTSAVADCVYVMFQLQHGYYNSSTAVQIEVNRLLGLLNATMATTIADNTGGCVNQYNASTSAILSADMTAALGTGDSDKDHLIFTLPATVVFNAGAVDVGGDVVPATTLDGGFQVLFGDGAGETNRLFSLTGRTANKILGFGEAARLPQTVGAFDFVGFPNTALDRDGTAVQNETSSFLASVLRTPYIYIRSNIARESRETSKKGNPTDLLCKVPITSNTYGSTMFYEPDDGSTLYFNLSAGDINNIQIRITDGDGVELDMDESNYELVLCFKGTFYN